MVPAIVVNWFFVFRNTLITSHCTPGDNKPIFCLLDETFDEFIKSYPDTNITKTRFRTAISEIEKAESALKLEPQVTCRRVGKKLKRYLFRFSRDCSPDKLLDFDEHVTNILSYMHQENVKLRKAKGGKERPDEDPIEAITSLIAMASSPPTPTSNVTSSTLGASTGSPASSSSISALTSSFGITSTSTSTSTSISTSTTIALAAMQPSKLGKVSKTLTFKKPKSYQKKTTKPLQSTSSPSILTSSTSSLAPSVQLNSTPQPTPNNRTELAPLSSPILSRRPNPASIASITSSTDMEDIDTCNDLPSLPPISHFIARSQSQPSSAESSPSAPSRVASFYRSLQSYMPSKDERPSSVYSLLHPINSPSPGLSSSADMPMTDSTSTTPSSKVLNHPAPSSSLSPTSSKHSDSKLGPSKPPIPPVSTFLHISSSSPSRQEIPPPLPSLTPLNTSSLASPSLSSHPPPTSSSPLLTASQPPLTSNSLSATAPFHFSFSFDNSDLERIPTGSFNPNHFFNRRKGDYMSRQTTFVRRPRKTRTWKLKYTNRFSHQSSASRTSVVDLTNSAEEDSSEEGESTNMAVDTQIQSLRYDKEALAPSKNLFSLRECNIVFPPLTKMDVQIVSSSGSSSVPTSDTESKPVFELVQSSLGQLTLSGSGAVTRQPIILPLSQHLLHSPDGDRRDSKTEPRMREKTNSEQARIDLSQMDMAKSPRERSGSFAEATQASELLRSVQTPTPALTQQLEEEKKKTDQPSSSQPLMDKLRTHLSELSTYPKFSLYHSFPPYTPVSQERFQQQLQEKDKNQDKEQREKVKEEEKAREKERERQKEVERERERERERGKEKERQREQGRELEKERERKERGDREKEDKAMMQKMQIKYHLQRDKPNRALSSSSSTSTSSSTPLSHPHVPYPLPSDQFKPSSAPSPSHLHHNHNNATYYNSSNVARHPHQPPPADFSKTYHYSPCDSTHAPTASPHHRPTNDPVHTQPRHEMLQRHHEPAHPSPTHQMPRVTNDRTTTTTHEMLRQSLDLGRVNIDIGRVNIDLTRAHDSGRGNYSSPRQHHAPIHNEASHMHELLQPPHKPTFTPHVGVHEVTRHHAQLYHSPPQPSPRAPLQPSMSELARLEIQRQTRHNMPLASSATYTHHYDHAPNDASRQTHEPLFRHVPLEPQGRKPFELLHPSRAPQDTLPQRAPQELSPRIPQEFSPRILQELSPRIPQELSPRMPQDLLTRKATYSPPQTSSNNPSSQQQRRPSFEHSSLSPQPTTSSRPPFEPSPYEFSRLAVHHSLYDPTRAAQYDMPRQPIHESLDFSRHSLPARNNMQEIVRKTINSEFAQKEKEYLAQKEIYTELTRHSEPPPRLSELPARVPEPRTSELPPRSPSDSRQSLELPRQVLQRPELHWQSYEVPRKLSDPPRPHKIPRLSGDQLPGSPNELTHDMRSPLATELRDSPRTPRDSPRQFRDSPRASPRQSPRQSPRVSPRPPLDPLQLHESPRGSPRQMMEPMRPSNELLPALEPPHNPSHPLPPSLQPRILDHHKLDFHRESCDDNKSDQEKREQETTKEGLPNWMTLPHCGRRPKRRRPTDL